jgi:transcriptional regulator GlxA family with amidase domain
MAAYALMSPRTFARRFKAATGAAPYNWLLAPRLNRAEELLETTNPKLEEIAKQIGYNSAAVLRDHLVKRRGVSPSLPSIIPASFLRQRIVRRGNC